jgi:hypothetical protein
MTKQNAVTIRYATRYAVEVIPTPGMRSHADSPPATFATREGAIAWARTHLSGFQPYAIRAIA